MTTIDGYEINDQARQDALSALAVLDVKRQGVTLRALALAVLSAPEGAQREQAWRQLSEHGDLPHVRYYDDAGRVERGLAALVVYLRDERRMRDE